ncbi:MAG TPA: FAD-dependent oxidoreductase [Acidimicrobiales bacterium]
MARGSPRCAARTSGSTSTRGGNLSKGSRPLVCMGSNSVVTVVGGGIAGLVAATTAAEEGAMVELHDAHATLGGRARSATSDGFVANLGPHALYADGPLWAWLRDRRLNPPCVTPAKRGFRFRWHGLSRRTPPAALVRALPVLRGDAPVDATFDEWVASRCGEEPARALAHAAGVVTFVAEPGELSAAFVLERLRRATKVPPGARFVVGGWSTLIDGLATRARDLGVRIVTSSPVDEVSTTRGPTVVATSLDAARRLLGDDTLRWPGARTALLDVGISSRRGDPYVVSDLDESGWVERFSIKDRSLAPAGHSLLQLHLGARGDEPLEDAVARAEALLDATYRGWREREVWRRRSVVDGATGAVDLPGTTWRDRPAIDRGDGVWLAGDAVAAPGLLAEVSWASGARAGKAAAAVSVASLASQPRMAMGSARGPRT